MKRVHIVPIAPECLPGDGFRLVEASRAEVVERACISLNGFIHYLRISTWSNDCVR